MTTDARDVWGATYKALSEGKPGLFGSVIGRAEAQVIRLALIYCLLDCADQIDGQDYGVIARDKRCNHNRDVSLAQAVSLIN